VSATVPPLDSATVHLPADVAVAGDPRREVLVVGDGDERAWWWFDAGRDLDLDDPTLCWEHAFQGQELVLSVTADTVVRELTIYPERVAPSATVDRQLVNLLAGETTSFRILGAREADVAALTSTPAMWHVAAVPG
jgi:beta-mannosidase